MAKETKLSASLRWTWGSLLHCLGLILWKRMISDEWERERCKFFLFLWGRDTRWRVLKWTRYVAVRQYCQLAILHLYALPSINNNFYIFLNIYICWTGRSNCEPVGQQVHQQVRLLNPCLSWRKEARCAMASPFEIILEIIFMLILQMRQAGNPQ